MATETQTSPPVDDDRQSTLEPEPEPVVEETVEEAWGDQGELFDLPEAACRERALPIRPGDLTRLLMAQESLGPEDRTHLGQFCRLLGATFHSEFYERLRDLKELYAPFDPDSDYVSLDGYTPQAADHPPEQFFDLLDVTLERANYHRLDIEIIKAAVQAPNELGLNYVPDFTLFEHMRIYVRGFTRITREARRAKGRFRKETVTLDAYQRLIVVLKFKETSRNLGPNVRTDVLYIRMFKDVPHVDMEMHLPEQGTKVKMRIMDKAQIASPFAVGIPTMIFKAMGALTTMGIAGLVVAPISVGINSFFGFQRAKQKHLTHMIRSLYYMTLANNASVLNRLIDSAEEEEYKETLLSYFFLWQATKGPAQTWTSDSLDTHIETFLKETTGVEVDFEIADALGKLFRLGLARRDGRGNIHARPIVQALEHLDRLWDNTFQYAGTTTAARKKNH